jgi:hypothetical protein
MTHGQRRSAWGGLSVLAMAALAIAACSSKGDKSDGGGSPDGGGNPLADGGNAKPCVNSLDCSNLDQVCDPTIKRCVQCVADADCKTPMKCVSSQCTTAAPTCQSNTDCASMAAAPVCDVPAGRCVRCLTAADCPASNDCTGAMCIPYMSCTNSLGCSTGQVCDMTRMRCVQCVGSNDCAADEVCASSVCKKKCASDNQCTSLGMLCDLARGYCVSCLTSADCKPEQYCLSGACVADVCTGGASSCQNNGQTSSVVHCRTDGSGFDPPTTCGTGQTCAVTSGTAACRAQVCTASVTYCDPLAGSEKVLTCSADGLTSTVKMDCAASSQVCVAATCAAVVCNKGAKFCQGQELRQCSTKGDASTLVQTCTAAQYCDATTLTCKTRLCTPNQPACSGNVLTTCNADGSGYVVGGTDCMPLYCVAGACSDAILREDWEDGNENGWVDGTGTYVRMISSIAGPTGATSMVFSLSKTTAGTVPDGVSYTFASPVQPKSISYWTKASSTVSALGYTRFVNGTDVLFYTYFATYLYAYYYSSYLATITTNTWYHVELRNIDWTTRTFDLYLNGTAVATGAKLSGTSSSITRIELYNTYYSTTAYTAYWDDIVLLP